MPAPVTHFEINLKDVARGHEFYQSLLGWKVTSMPEMNYGMVDTGVKMGINGGIGVVAEGGNPTVVFYAQVGDVQAKLDRAVQLGGTVLVPVTEVPGMVTFAQFADPEGNIIGLIQGPETPPAAPRKRATATRAAGKRPKAKSKVKAGAKTRPKRKAKSSARPKKKTRSRRSTRKRR
jgi:predicted enzyme related to lactoylglutathione lyase